MQGFCSFETQTGDTLLQIELQYFYRIFEKFSKFFSQHTDFIELWQKKYFHVIILDRWLFLIRLFFKKSLYFQKILQILKSEFAFIAPCFTEANFESVRKIYHRPSKNSFETFFTRGQKVFWCFYNDFISEIKSLSVSWFALVFTQNFVTLDFCQNIEKSIRSL